MNINPAYRLHELRHALNLVSPRALVISEKFRSQSLVDIVRELQQSPQHPEKKQPAGGNELFSSPLAPSLERVIVLSDERPNLR